MFQHKGIQHFTHPTSLLCHKTTKAFLSFLASLTLNNPLETHITIHKIHNRPFEIHEERIQPTTSQRGILPRAAPTQSKSSLKAHEHREHSISRVSHASWTNMCLFVETHYSNCKHTCFELYIFCREVLHQLNRINDPDQRRDYDLPFDPGCPTCQPYTVTMRSAILRPEMGYLSVISESNIVHQMMVLVESCPDCKAKAL
ncbi:hypothetical protein ACN38_g9909 [Penicillium nordicum]|uniref:Uncharacterized protein n=1 Tax=Penicillium nordicum TaxID=229535 RepID=A0A0M9WC57_9EURO|nr:hypothetical protein ACN38_g9909 [Penicillium nordicum]